MGYMYRYNPGVVLMRDLVEKGWLGEPFELRGVMSKLTGPGHGRNEPAIYPGGMMFELGGHMIDTIVKILGEPDRVTPFLQSVDPFGDGLADNTLAVFEYPKALAEMKTSVLEVEGGARRHMTLCGTEGTLHIQPMGSPKGRLALLKPHGKYKKGYQSVEFPRYPRYVDDIKDLAGMIRGEWENRFSPSHDLAVQETLLRASGMTIS
jgi:predicted dehydrogenase